MNCHDLRNSLSARFDGELDTEACARFEEHCASCDSCATAWRDFFRSTRALRDVGVGAVSDGYVDSIVGAVFDGASVAQPIAPPGNRRLRLLTHAAAALLGAALVLLYTTLSAPTASSRIDSDASGTLAGTTTSEPAGPANLDLTSPAVAEREPLPPTIQVVEHYIDRVEYVPLLIPAEKSASSDRIAKAVTRLGDALSGLSESLAKHSQVLAANTESPRIENSASTKTTVSEPATKGGTPAAAPERRRIEPQAPLRAIARLEAPKANVSLVSRDGTLSLETHGTLDEVVPALIVRLDDPDPRVGELVEQRLRQIWSERTGRDADQATIGVVEAGNKGRFGWKRWFSGESPAETTVDSSEAWSSWWSDERGLVATAGI